MCKMCKNGGHCCGKKQELVLVALIAGAIIWPLWLLMKATSKK